MYMKHFETKVVEFNDFLTESENKTESMRNYKEYINGNEPLKHAILTHKEGDSAYDYVKNSITRNFWVNSKEHFDKILSNHQDALASVLASRK